MNYLFGMGAFVSSAFSFPVFFLLSLFFFFLFFLFFVVVLLVHGIYLYVCLRVVAHQFGNLRWLSQRAQDRWENALGNSFSGNLNLGAVSRFKGGKGREREISIFSVFYLDSHPLCHSDDSITRIRFLRPSFLSFLVFFFTLFFSVTFAP